VAVLVWHEADSVRVRVEELVPPCLRVSCEGLKDAVTQEGRLVGLSETVPLNPLRLVRLTVVDPDRPAGIVTDQGDTVREKSFTWTVIVTKCDRYPLWTQAVIV
jgi:hypothetical protein